MNRLMMGIVLLMAIPAGAEPPASSGITREGNVATVPKYALDDLLDNPRHLARQARVIPAMQDGKNIGFKIYGMRKSSIYRSIGFQSGDTITTVNGRPLTSPAAALEIYAELRDAKRIKLGAIRRGEPFEVVVVLDATLKRPKKEARRRRVRRPPVRFERWDVKLEGALTTSVALDLAKSSVLEERGSATITVKSAWARQIKFGGTVPLTLPDLNFGLIEGEAKLMGKTFRFDTLKSTGGEVLVTAEPGATLSFDRIVLRAQLKVSARLSAAHLKVPKNLEFWTALGVTSPRFAGLAKGESIRLKCQYRVRPSCSVIED